MLVEDLNEAEEALNLTLEAEEVLTLVCGAEEAATLVMASQEETSAFKNRLSKKHPNNTKPKCQ